MAAFSDILLRTEVILKKYEHYVEGETGKRQKRKKTDDLFTDRYFEIMDRAQEMSLKAESIVGEKNRALKAALNAELRKEKAALHQEVTELYPLIKKKGLSQDELEEREARFQEVQEAVANIDDGTGNIGVRKPTRELSMGRSSSLRTGYSGNGTLSGSLSYEGAYEHTDETLKFVKDASVARERQDAQLENIERGVDTLKEIGAAMGEELERHDVVIDEVGEKMDVVTKELQTNNMKLKGVLNQVRSSRKIFIDIILICILLAVGLYIYSMFD